MVSSRHFKFSRDDSLIRSDAPVIQASSHNLQTWPTANLQNRPPSTTSSHTNTSNHDATRRPPRPPRCRLHRRVHLQPSQPRALGKLLVVIFVIFRMVLLGLPPPATRSHAHSVPTGIASPQGFGWQASSFWRVLAGLETQAPPKKEKSQWWGQPQQWRRRRWRRTLGL